MKRRATVADRLITKKHVQIASKTKDPPPTFVEGFHDAEKVHQMQYNTFGNTGYEVSKLGLDASEYCDALGAEYCKQTIKLALQAGVNYIDTGSNCEKAEEIVGESLKNIPRQAYYITINVGCYGKAWDFSPQKTEQNIRGSLRRLGLDHVDIIQIRDIEKAPSLDYLIKDTLPVLLKAVKDGKAKFIGISGYPLRIIENFIEKCPYKIDVITSHCRFTILDHSLLEYEENFKDIGVVNASSLGMGLFTNIGAEDSNPAPEITKEICEEARICCIRNKVQFEKIAMHHVFKTSKYWPHTHVIEINSPKQLQVFLDTIFAGLYEREYQVYNELEMEILSKSRFQHWEDDGPRLSF